jgi:hypothetical protein
MIRVTVEHTRDLGPEADIPGLLEKIGRLLASHGPPIAGEHLLVCAREIRDFVPIEGGWETLHGRIAASPAAAGAFAGGLLEELTALAERHLGELLSRRSVAFHFDLEVPTASFERMRPKPAGGPGF